MYRSGFLLEVYNGWLNIGVHPIRFFGPETFLKQIGQWWYWLIFEFRFKMSGICSLISWNFFLSACNLFNFIDCNLLNFIVRNLFNYFACVWYSCFEIIWYNCFARVCALICLIFVERDIIIFLDISLSPILVRLWDYNITINGNFSNFIEIYITMWWIRWTNFGLFMTTAIMFSHVLVYGMYIFYFKFVHIQNIFHIIDGSFFFCARVFEGWST